MTERRRRTRLRSGKARTTPGKQRTKMRGIFITFEGPEGSGKSTQVGRLTKRLHSIGHEVVSAREPGGTSVGDVIRDIVKHGRGEETIFPETETFLFAAGRAQLVHSVILPALERGVCVVCDRFADSTTAYQGYGRGFDIEKILSINALTINGVVPDLTILLDIDVKLGFERLRKRNITKNGKYDRFEQEEMRFHEKVRAGYLKLAKRWPERFRVIDGDRDPNAVEAEIWEIVEERINRFRGKRVESREMKRKTDNEH